MSETASRVHPPTSPTGDERQLVMVRRGGGGGEWAASSAQAAGLLPLHIPSRRHEPASLLACILWLALPHANGCLLLELLGWIVMRLPGWCQPC